MRKQSRSEVVRKLYAVPKWRFEGSFTSVNKPCFKVQFSHCVNSQNYRSVNWSYTIGSNAKVFLFFDSSTDK